MPRYEDGFLAIVWCHHCETPQQQWRSLDGDPFSARCECTDFEVSGLTLSPNGPVMAAVSRPERINGIRPSRRTLSMSRGRLWRERWRCEAGTILESGEDFVIVPNAEGQMQVWVKSFEEAFLGLTGQPWRLEEGGEP